MLVEEPSRSPMVRHIVDSWSPVAALGQGPKYAMNDLGEARSFGEKKHNDFAFARPSPRQVTTLSTASPNHLQP